MLPICTQTIYKLIKYKIKFTIEGKEKTEMNK